VLHLCPLQDVTVKTPLYGMNDVSRVKHALGMEGEQTIFSCRCSLFAPSNLGLVMEMGG
jgi:hypothetical protein